MNDRANYQFEDDSAPSGSQKIRPKRQHRIVPSGKRSAPTAFNGIHRRRRKRIRW
jgi:hypothetical protein